MASLAEHFLLACMFLLPRLSFAHRGGHTARDGKYIERVQARYTDFSRGELNDKWLPQKEPDGFNILFDALKKWRPSSSTNFVKVQYQDGRRYSVSSNEASYVVPYNPKRNVCPKFPTRPSCSSYSQSTCWSPGVPDVDCPNHGLCCFNGCSNVCIPQNKPPLRKGTRPSRRPTNPTQQAGHFNIADAAPAPSNKPKLSYNNIFNTYQSQSAVITTTTRKPQSTQPTEEQYEYNEPAQIQSPDSTINQDDPNKCSLIDPKPATMCLNKKANCWSAGVLDLDCPNSGLCCFDGCVNSCVDMPNESYNQDSIQDEADATYADLSEDTNIYSDDQSDPLADPVQQEDTQPDIFQDKPSDNPYQCPYIEPEPSYSCVNKKANCWSPGVLDLDCPNSGLCCFDGCVNTCVDMEDEAPSQSNPDLSEETLSVPDSDPADEIYSDLANPVQQEDTQPDFFQDNPSDDPNQCPYIEPEPSYSCVNKKANCWSPGVLDLDCPNSGLCCFDGCVNTCVDMEDEALGQSNPNPSEDSFSVPASDPENEIYIDNPYQCPAIVSEPSHSCANKKANCWSAGVLDLDCPDYGLCCFDGCVNSCVDKVKESASQSSPQPNDQKLSENIPELADNTPDYSDNIDANPIIPYDPDKCPFVTPKPRSSCANRIANCWSVGVPDLDCPNYGLCCYDGCVNSCIAMKNETKSESNQHLSQEQPEEISPDPTQDTSLNSDNPQDNLEQPSQTYLDPPQETPSYSDNPDKCTFVTPKPANSCLNKKANCWSAGVLDLDCPNSGLCCFDGCVNTCVEMNKEAHIQSIPDSSKQTFSAPLPDIGEEMYDISLPESMEEIDPEEIDEYSPHLDSYGSPTADPVKLNTDENSYSSSTKNKKGSNKNHQNSAQTPNSQEEIFAGPFQDINAHSDNPTHGANMNTINNLQITNITENEPSDVANSDEFVFPLSSSADPIQNTIMLLLDTYGPPKTNQVKPSDNEPTELDDLAYNPHIDSYGSPTADPVKVVTAESSHFTSTANIDDNNYVDHYQSTHYDSGSTVPNLEKDRYNVPNLDNVRPIKTSYIKPTVNPVQQSFPSSRPQQNEYTKYTNPVNYGLKLSNTKIQNPRKYKPKKILNYASIDGYGSPLADPIRDVEKLVNTRKSAYLKPIQTGLKPVGKPNSQFSPIFYESVRLTTPRSNIYRQKDKYVKKILKKKYIKSSNKQQVKKPSEQKSSLGKFWERHFGFFPILEQPTSKLSTVRPSSCPEVQSRSPEDCKLNYQNYCTKLGKRDRLCPYDDICCYDGCANRCLNWKPPQNVFFRDSVGVFVQ